MSNTPAPRPRLMSIATALALASASAHGAANAFNALRAALRLHSQIGRVSGNPAPPRYRRHRVAEGKRLARRTRNRLRARGHFRAAVR